MPRISSSAHYSTSRPGYPFRTLDEVHVRLVRYLIRRPVVHHREVPFVVEVVECPSLRREPRSEHFIRDQLHLAHRLQQNNVPKIELKPSDKKRVPMVPLREVRANWSVMKHFRIGLSDNYERAARLVERFDNPRRLLRAALEHAVLL